LLMTGLTIRLPLHRPVSPVGMTTPAMRLPTAGRAAAMLILAAVGASLHAPGPARAAAIADAALVEVGPSRPLKTLAEAARVASDGATVQVDAGTYVGDVAVWTQNHLTLRAVGGRVRLVANGAAAEGKGTWVVRAEGVAVEGFDFEGSAVPDRNGAGIRLERGSLRVTDCSFTHNEMGILTANDPTITLEIENSQFGHNMRPDGHNHNLYAGTIKRLSVTGSYFHHAAEGHLLKSRAALNYIMYNRLTDEDGGRASYELEFPNGGIALVVGNIIQQGPLTENPHLISYGAEGYRWSTNRLTLIHNTLVDGRAEPGVFVRVSPGGGTDVRAIGNLLVGGAHWSLPDSADVHDNLRVTQADFDPSTPGDYRLLRRSRAWGAAVASPAAADERQWPTREYRHPHRTAALSGPPRQPGAVQSPATPTP